MAEPAQPEAPKKSGAERRRVLVILDTWRDICGERPYPAQDDITGDEIGDLWSLAFQLDASGERFSNPVFTHFGRDLVPSTGVNLIHQPLSRAPMNTVVANSASYYRTVMNEALPMSEGGEFHDDQGQRVLFRSILLPLGPEGSDPDGVLGLATHKIA